MSKLPAHSDAMGKLRRSCEAYFAGFTAQTPVLLWGEAVGAQRGAPILALVGESPTQRGILENSQLAGRSGKAVAALLEALGSPPAYVTLAVKQRAVRADGTPRAPNREEIALWAPWLVRELELAAPRVIVAMGATAQRALAGRADFIPMRHPAAPGDSLETAQQAVSELRALLKRLSPGPANPERPRPKPPGKPRATT